MEIEKIEKTIYQVATTINSALGYEKYSDLDTHIQRASAFLTRINPKYPTDSVDLLDMVLAVLRQENLPRPDEINILEEKLRKADFYGGNLVWRYKTGVLEAHFIDKDCQYYEIFFEGINGATRFPLTVTVHIYACMGNEENHAEDCPIYFPEHSDDCPLSILIKSNQNPSKEELEAAEEECECAASYCDCEPALIRTEQRTFRRRDEWIADFEQWLLAAHWNGLHINDSSMHKITFVVTEGKSISAECSCGKWVASATTDNPESELYDRWLEHLKMA